MFDSDRPRRKFLLKLKGEGPVRSLGLRGIRVEPGRYFGGADLDDFWFSDKAGAHRFGRKIDAERAARMYGLGQIREFEIEEEEA